MQLSLADTLKIHRAAGRKSLTPVMMGNEVELFFRDAVTGELQGHVKKHNMATRFFHQNLIIDNFTTGYITISNDPTIMNPWKTVARATYANTMLITATASVNSTAKTWTYTATLLAPTAPGRVFQFVGVSKNIETVGTTNARCTQGIFCGTTLSSELTQLSTQSLEIVYRIQLVRV